MKNLMTFVLIVVFSSGLQGQAPDKTKVVAGAERAFEKAAKTNIGAAPGCAVGVSLNGESVFEKAFGMAEMEHGISNTTQTIFESGSIAKQFTAAAIVMLSLDGKLSIDDPVRKYVPEMPDYGKTITIRHLLTHTAGLRDWGSVMALTGAGRGDRVISQAIALDVVYRQKHLDFVPGAEYSYSNSGYQLATEIVERVSKKKFPAFVEERIFKPLGMKHSSTRDNYQRIIPGRAQAYSRQGANGPWELNMPFMNVYGNGGMLTTVGDLLKWNAAMDAKAFGESFANALETQSVLNDGRKIDYSLGLHVEVFKDGIKDFTHAGETAGYNTFLARFPDKKLSVAVLCNGNGNSPGGLAYDVFEEIFGAPPEPPKVESVVVPDGQLRKYAGIWKNDITRNVNALTLDKGELKLGNTVLKPVADGSFMLGDRKMKFVDGIPVTATINNTDGSVTRLTLITAWTPSAADLLAFAGDWHSEEAQATLTFSVEGDKAFIVQRPTTRLPLRPIYKDHFATQGFVVWVTRDAKGNIDKLHVGGSRMRDMMFGRIRK